MKYSTMPLSPLSLHDVDNQDTKHSRPNLERNTQRILVEPCQRLIIVSLAYPIIFASYVH